MANDKIGKLCYTERALEKQDDSGNTHGRQSFPRPGGIAFLLNRQLVYTNWKERDHERPERQKTQH